MKIAIATDEQNLDATISLKAGRAPYYLIFENQELLETIKNPFAVGGGGAGWSVAYMLADKKIDLVVAGKLGDNFKTALAEKNLKFQEITGQSVADFLKTL